MTAWSSTRFPGFALGGIPYGGVGVVVMCSTRSLRGIILIETGKKKYGVTPADEAEFLSELEGFLEAR
ncbi:MAG: PH domain-containing protein [Bacillota bacterium]